MSWSNLLGNQTVSRANIQDAIDTGVFVQRNGVPGTETNRQITKANAIDYIYAWELYSALQSKASNQLVTKSNLAVQSMQFFGTNDGGNAYLYVGNNNRSWVYRIWTANSYNQIASIASSIDGKYILIGRYGSDNASFFLSSTYGEVFNLRTDIIGLGDAVAGVAMSNSGQVMIATRQKGSSGGALPVKIYQSNDYGSTWSLIYTSPNEAYVNGAAMSSDGSHWSVLIYDTSSSSYYIAKRDLSTLTTVGLTYTGVLIQAQSACLAMSKSGSYQLACPPKPVNSSFVYTFNLSTDYGATWSTITVPSGNPIQFTGCTVSASGQYMSVSATSPSAQGGYIYTSSNFGTTWSLAVTYNAGTGGSYLSYVTSDTSGQFQYASYTGTLEFSQNYGQTPWNILSLPVGANTAISVAQITGTTPYIYGLLDNVYGTYLPKYTKTTGVSGAQFNNVGGLTAGTYNYIAASGNSNNGKYVATISWNGTNSYLWISSDYGQTFVTNFGTAGEEAKCCAVSDNGVYFLVVTYNSSTNTSYIYRSANSGASFQYIYVTQTGIPKNCDMSGDGKYSTIVFNDTVANVTRTMSSADYSATFPTYHFFNARKAGDICMSNAGRYRTVTMTDTANVSIMWRSTNYGVSWDLDARFSYGFWDYVANDNSGQVQIIGLNATNGIGSLIYTTDRWATTGSFYPENSELVPQLIGGVNISNDATYWTIVTTDGYSYVSTNAGASWSPTNLGYTNTFKLLSK